MRIFRNGSRGNLYAVDYTIGDSPTMLHHTFQIANPVSLEGHINSALAELHDVSVAQVGVYQIVRCGE
jgi:hypothetical protein